MTAALRTRTSLEDALVAWVVLVFPTGRCALGWGGGPRPALPYLTVRIMGVDPIGQDDRGPVDLTTGVQVIYGDRLLQVSVQGYGPGALDKVRAMANSIWKETVASVLLAAGLCAHNPGPVNDLTQFLETVPEERAHVDIKFGIKDLDTDQVGVIEHVAGDGAVVADGEQKFGVLGSAILGESPIGGVPLLTVSFTADLE